MIETSLMKELTGKIVPTFLKRKPVIKSHNNLTIRCNIIYIQSVSVTQNMPMIATDVVFTNEMF